MPLTIRPIQPDELLRLTALCDYNDVPAMIAENTRLIESGDFSIYLLFEHGTLIGEIHITWRSDDPLAAIGGQRAYLSAFRIREERQGLGYGQYLLREVIRLIEEAGYREIAIGVEEDNARAKYLYRKFGFTEFVERRSECYQGDAYEYDLLMRRSADE
ncbi:MAG: GNAT family N-acetyltransferase [Clostridia bacterium]|nr:GNAT family N-acetyltransferase [Clostridia bacterium]